MRMVFLQRQDPQNNAWASLLTALVLSYVLRPMEISLAEYAILARWYHCVGNKARVKKSTKYIVLSCTLYHPYFYSHAPRHKWEWPCSGSPPLSTISVGP